MEAGTTKFSTEGLRHFAGAHPESHLVAGAVAWLECAVVPEPRNQSQHDLFIGQVDAAWADSRVFQGGRWTIDATTPPGLRPLHYVAGGQFYTLGEPWVETGVTSA